MADPVPDGGVLTAIIGAIGTAATAIAGGIKWFFVRLDQHKLDVSQVTDAIKRDVKETTGALWNRVTEHEKLLRDVPTKADLTALRNDIRDDIRLLLQPRGRD